MAGARSGHPSDGNESNVQGSADLGNITFNGQAEVPSPASKDQCKHDGWKTFTSPSFRNQGQCVSFFEHHDGRGHDDDNAQGDDNRGHHQDG